jgi:NAD-dependent DNA ligase
MNSCTKEQSANKDLVDYLVHCCLYYELDHSFFTDHQFDRLARRLANNWEHVTNPHKSCVDVKHLRVSSSGYYIKYPTIVRDVAQRLKDGTLALR